MTDEEGMDLFRCAAKSVAVAIPGFEVRYKEDNLISKIIAVLVWLFNRDYMTSYTTTRYPKVYFPSRQYVEDRPMRAVKILFHEFVHLSDRKRLGVWFTIGYALPQLLAVVLLIALAVSAFVGSWVLSVCVMVAVLAFMSPLPAHWRMKFEMRGYTMNMAINLWRFSSVTARTRDWIAKQFVGPAYYFMWPFPNDVDKRIEAAVSVLEQSNKADVDVYEVVYDFLKVNGVVK